jgi:MoaA/NifB/PqqE/SkfB family radical SAM enzyme
MSEISPQIQKNIETRDRLNAVSTSFCLAKWLQATIHLHRGLTHSCHHPEAHLIPIEDLEKNVASLHNTQEKIRQRSEMMDGIRPTGCSYCWNIEEFGYDRFSDRILKSQDEWSMPNLEEVLKDPLSASLRPKYLEISFSRACNFRCTYCSPAFSTKWLQDVLKDGQYPGREFESGSQMLEEPFEEETNPYIQAFWKWWPELKDSLHTFRITGGEPLLSPNTFRLLEMLDKDPAPNLSFSINSNLGIPEEKVNRLIQGVGKLLEGKKAKKFDLFTSMEAWGKKAEYIRFGMDTELFWRNLENVLIQLPTVSVTIMCTFNILSVTSFKQFLERVLELREKYHVKKARPCPLFVDISYLQNPSFQAINLLPKDYLADMEKIVQFVNENRAEKRGNYWGFYSFEETKIRRCQEWMNQGLPEKKLKEERAKFYRYYSEYDRRRKANFLETFPEMKEFWQICKIEAENEKLPQ